MYPRTLGTWPSVVVGNITLYRHTYMPAVGSKFCATWQEEKTARETAEARAAELQEQLSRTAQDAADEAKRVAEQQAELSRKAEIQLEEVGDDCARITLTRR